MAKEEKIGLAPLLFVSMCSLSNCVLCPHPPLSQSSITITIILIAITITIITVITILLIIRSALSLTVDAAQERAQALEQRCAELEVVNFLVSKQAK